MNPIVQQLLAHDPPRWEMFSRALRYVDYEDVPGDILEFGTYTGRSLALLSHAARSGDYRETHAVLQSRRVHGYDSFRGMPAGSGHPRWPAGQFASNHSWHPLLARGEPVTPDVVCDLFRRAELTPPVLHVGDYSGLCHADPQSPTAAAVVHVDCDLYESTVPVLEYCTPILQPGTVVLFDDWYHYRADPQRGEHRAFREWEDSHPAIRVTPWHTYATFGRAWIVQKA